MTNNEVYAGIIENISTSDTYIVYNLTLMDYSHSIVLRRCNPSHQSQSLELNRRRTKYRAQQTEKGILGKSYK